MAFWIRVKASIIGFFKYIAHCLFIMDPGTLGASQEYALDGIPVHHKYLDVIEVIVNMLFYTFVRT